jgi:hypothetical protein
MKLMNLLIIVNIGRKLFVSLMMEIISLNKSD